MKFTEASAVTRVSPGTYTAESQPGWDIFGVINGGYTLAMTARAMGEDAGDRQLISISGRFVNPTPVGPLKVSTETVKVGRSLTTMAATTSFDERTTIISSASFSDGRHGGVNDQIAIHSSPPDLPPVDECVRLTPSPDAPLPPPFTGQVGVFLHPDDITVSDLTRARAPTVRAWFRLLDGELIDPYGLVMASDALPPAVFNSGLPMGWTPTIDLTVHVRDPGPHEWIRCSTTTRFINDGLLEEDGEYWDLKGNLIAQSRQLALLAR